MHLDAAIGSPGHESHERVKDYPCVVCVLACPVHAAGFQPQLVDSFKQGHVCLGQQFDCQLLKLVISQRELVGSKAFERHFLRVLQDLGVGFMLQYRADKKLAEINRLFVLAQGRAVHW